MVDEKVYKKVEIKKVGYAELVNSKNEEEKCMNMEEYTLATIEINLVVIIDKTIAFESLYLELEEKDRDKKFYRLAKAKEQRVHDLD